MQQTRRARLAAVIQQELSMVVPREVKDPRVPNVTFTQVDVTDDGSEATVYVTILGGVQAGTEAEGMPQLSEKAAKLRMQDCLDGLTSAGGFLRRHLARVLTVRHIPKLTFIEDRGLENSTRVYELLQKLETEKKASS